MTNQNPSSTSQRAEKERIARSIPDKVFTEGDIELLDELYAEDAVEHNAFGTQHGHAAIEDAYESFSAAFPDITQTVENIVVEDDTVAVYITSRGTHEGALMGMEPTGNEIEVEQMFFARITDGQIQERWFLPDNLTLLQQLGVIDFPPQ